MFASVVRMGCKITLVSITVNHSVTQMCVFPLGLSVCAPVTHLKWSHSTLMMISSSEKKNNHRDVSVPVEPGTHTPDAAAQPCCSALIQNKKCPGKKKNEPWHGRINMRSLPTLESSKAITAGLFYDETAASGGGLREWAIGTQTVFLHKQQDETRGWQR